MGRWFVSLCITLLMASPMLRAMNDALAADEMFERDFVPDPKYKFKNLSVDEVKKINSGIDLAEANVEELRKPSFLWSDKKLQRKIVYFEQRDSLQEKKSLLANLSVFAIDTQLFDKAVADIRIAQQINSIPVGADPLVVAKILANNKKNEQSLHDLKNEIIFLQALGRFRGTIDDNEFRYVFMDFLPGSSLQRMLEKHISDDDRNFIALAVIKSIYEFHRLSFLHNDIKPGNVVVEKRKKSRNKYVAHLIDFGQSCPMSCPNRENTGSSGFRDPARCVSDRPPQRREHDLWALGIVLLGIYQKPNNSYYKRILHEQSDGHIFDPTPEILLEIFHENLRGLVYDAQRGELREFVDVKDRFRLKQKSPGSLTHFIYYDAASKQYKNLEAVREQLDDFFLAQEETGDSLKIEIIKFAKKCVSSQDKRPIPDEIRKFLMENTGRDPDKKLTLLDTQQLAEIHDSYMKLKDSAPDYSIKKNAKNIFLNSDERRGRKSSRPWSPRGNSPSSSYTTSDSTGSMHSPKSPSSRTHRLKKSLTPQNSFGARVSHSTSSSMLPITQNPGED